MCNLSGSVTDVSPLHLENEFLPRLDKFGESERLVSPVQPEKASASTRVNVCGSVTDVSPLH